MHGPLTERIVNKRKADCLCQCRSHNGFLTAKGLKEAAQREVFLDGVDGLDMFGYLDKVGSVSALVEVEDAYMGVPDQLLLEQCERFHNGS